MVDDPFGPLQQAGVGGAVRLQQARRRLQAVDRRDQVVLARAEKGGPLAGQPNGVEQQAVQLTLVVDDGGAGGRRRVQDGDDVLRGSAVGVAEVLQGTHIVTKDVIAGVERGQDLVQCGGRSTDPLSAAPYPLGEGGQDGVEFHGVDHLEQIDDVLEDGVDFGRHRRGLQDRTGEQALGFRVFRIDQVDEFRAEHRRDIDARTDIGGDVANLVGVDVEQQSGVTPAAFDLANAAYVHAPHLDLRAGLEHQSGPIRGQCHRHRGAKCPEKRRRGGKHEYRDDGH